MARATDKGTTGTNAPGIIAPIAGHLPSFTDETGPMGIRVSRVVAGNVVVFGAVRRATFVLPLYSTVLARADAADGDAEIDVGAWLLVPPGHRGRFRAVSPVSTTLAIAPSDALLAEVVRTYAGQIEATALATTMATSCCIPRTTWINEIAQRYAFERAVCTKRDNAATIFLEVELVKEWFFIRRDQERAASRASHLARSTSMIEVALAYIDAQLDQPLSIAALAAAAHTSPRALLRAFQRAVGVPPATYIRTRRLDEARLLLRSARYDVGEVAQRVGYQNFSAFSQAYKARFGHPPSCAQPVRAEERKP